MTNKEIKALILKSIQACRDEGVILVYQDWGDIKSTGDPKNQKCACPLGCVLLAAGIDDLNDVHDNVAEVSNLLGVSENWVTYFTDSFDHQFQPLITGKEGRDASDMGKALFMELKPVQYDEWKDGLEDEVLGI